MPRNTQSNRGSNRRRSNNNNPEGHNQYSGGWMDSARERPFTTAVTAAAAVGAGVFLWSRRGQISEQLSNLSDQIGDMTSGSGSEEFEMADSGSSRSWSSGSSAGSSGEFSGSGATGSGMSGTTGIGTTTGSTTGSAVGKGAKSGGAGSGSATSGSNRSRS